MPNSIAFLAARVDEDAADAPNQPDPARALREVAAKRWIITEYEGAMSGWPPSEGPAPDLLTLGLSLAIRALCWAYSDHSDYQQEWKIQ